MSSLQLELVAGPLRSMRRAIVWWSVGMAALVALTLVFWPIFKGSTGITDALNHLPSSVLAAFGLQDFGSPSGYLRANLNEILVPNLLVPQIADTLAELSVPRIYVCNVMTQPGETDNFTAVDHVQAILDHVEGPIFDYVLLNTRRPSAEVLARYAAEGAHLVEADARGIARLGLVPIGRDLIAEGSWARHDPIKLAQAIIELVAEHR